MLKATLHVVFLSQPKDGGQGYARLKVDLPFAPTTDVEFEHPVWQEPRKPESISYNLENESFYVCFESEKLATKEQAAERREVYKTHDWDVSE